MNPSADFLIFKRQFFDDPWTAVRGEYDRDALRRLAGAERDLAEVLIEENLEVGPQFANAAADLGLVRLAPRLRECMGADGDAFELCLALGRLGAMTPEEVFEVWWQMAAKDKFYFEEALPRACGALRPADAARFIRAGLEARDFGIRIDAYMALLELEDMAAAGGQHTASIAEASRQRWIEVFTSDAAADAQHRAAGGRRRNAAQIAELIARTDRACCRRPTPASSRRAARMPPS